MSNAPKLTTVLVADDDEQLLRLCSRLLERRDYHVLPARDGDEALRVFRDHQDEIGAVVLDATLPPKGAAAVFEAIVGEGGDLRAVFTGGDAPSPSLQALISDDRGVFLHKPFPGAALVRAVAGEPPPEDA